jgi:hypothetical protein
VNPDFHEELRALMARHGELRTDDPVKDLGRVMAALSRDPKYTPVNLRLELLTGKAVGIMRTAPDSGQFMLWAYDPRNRIGTPTTQVYQDVPSMLAALRAWFGYRDPEPDGAKP